MKQNNQLGKLAFESMKKFFKNKKTCLGKPLPKDKIFSLINLKIVATMDIIRACDIAYASMSKYHRPSGITIKSKNVDWQIEVVLGLLNEMKMLKIQKEFHGGLIILYLKYCRGYMLVN